MQPAHQLERRLRVRGAFHIHAQKGPNTPRMRDQVADDLLRQPWAQVHTHLCELHAYIGIKLSLVDGIEQLVVHGGRLLRLFRGMDVLAQAVERRLQPITVERGSRAQHILNLEPGDKAARNATACGRSLRKAAQRLVLRSFHDCASPDITRRYVPSCGPAAENRPRRYGAGLPSSGSSAR